MKNEDYREILKAENQKRILRSLREKGNLTFKILLEETNLARSTLASHLKDLLKEGKIEKFYNVYRIIKKGIIEDWVKGTIEYLGIVATHYIVRKKLNLSIENCDIYEEIDEYLKGKPKDVTFQELFEYLEKEYPLIM